MNIRTETRRIRLQEWRRIIEDKISSGLTIEEYCRTNNLSVHTYKYWLHILREEELNQQHTPFTELVVADKTAVAQITEVASSITINIGKEQSILSTKILYMYMLVKTLMVTIVLLRRMVLRCL